ncbi:hypothetical protein EYF80_025121 [Liparis tanakae]|uniref:Uncharacterized protein n=1 Tax=Liparis tanakae TaxID=230148 RepID=A0A4Z2HID2_9TELE|nr:hypothetical protein EYF80_025121 [Liparis tanakae]
MLYRELNLITGPWGADLVFDAFVKTERQFLSSGEFDEADLSVETRPFRRCLPLSSTSKGVRQFDSRIEMKRGCRLPTPCDLLPSRRRGCNELNVPLAAPHLCKARTHAGDVGAVRGTGGRLEAQKEAKQRQGDGGMGGVGGYS